MVKNKQDKRPKNKKQTSKFNTLQCSPGHGNKTLKNSTCYEDKILFQMKYIWNKYNKNKIQSNNPYDIWLFFKNNFKGNCGNEMCWLKYKNFNTNLDINELRENFRPFAPEKWKTNFHEWLSSLDIINVMKQYEENLY